MTRTLIRRWLRNRSGATAIEYGLVAGLIAAVAVVGMARLGNSNNGLYGRIGSAFNTYIP